MYLKALSLRGFKSFATATTLRFEPGINCVVGPNGSGKSNVVDALAWVMGEQGARALRGSAMADVIFAGTTARPALGRAEVSLTIDNTDGALPIDFSEVTIARTLFRSGGSEYSINATPCRLLDIQELLSDTGMGREMHVIIGQGKLDQVLTASAEERRSFVEEAAGVLKHRRRKEKALRKLDTMQEKLTRIEDIAAELRRQLGPLAKQAATARKAQIIQRDVFDASARLLADDAAQAQARLESYTAGQKELDVARKQCVRERELLREKLEQFQRIEQQRNPYIVSLNEQHQRLSSLAERFRSLSDLAQERIRSLQEASARGYQGEDPDRMRERARAARDEQENLARHVEEAQTQVHQAIAEREKADHEESELSAQLAGVQRAQADRRENLARLSGKITAVQSGIDVLKAERERVAVAQSQAQKRADQALADVAHMEQDAVAYSGTDDELAQRYEHEISVLQTNKDALKQARSDMDRAQAHAVQWQTKADTLKMSLAPEDATAWALEQSGAGIRGLVRDRLHVKSGWEAAIETALSGLAGGVRTGSTQSAVDTLRIARDEQAGHLDLLIEEKFMPESHGHEHTTRYGEILHLLNDVARAACAASAVNESDAVLASDVLLGSDPASEAARAIVAGTVLAVDLVTARALLDAGAPRVVTMGADVLTPYSASGGAENCGTGAVLARQAMYEDAARRAMRALDAHSEASIAYEKAQEAVARQNDVCDDLSAQVSARDSQLAAVTAQLGVLRQSVVAAQEEVARDTARLSEIDSEIEARGVELSGLNQQQLSVGADPQDMQAQVKELSLALNEAHRLAVERRAAETQARLSLRTAQERLQAVRDRADSLMHSAHAAQERFRREQQAAVMRENALCSAQGVEEQAQRAALLVQHLCSRIDMRRKSEEEAGSEHRERMSALRVKLDDVQRRERDIESDAHQREVALAEQRVKCEQLEAAAQEKMGMDTAALINEFGPHLPVPVVDEGDSDDSREPRQARTVPYVRNDQEKRLSRARKALSRLGKINPLALEEHAALQERQKFLMEQLQDLRRSRDDLLTIVSDIDRRVKEVMESALHDVSEQFVEVFSSLFPGGEGRLVLTDPDHLLTTGVDIEARPAGKRVKRLSLLSGGERSLTAIAFLIAIFMARPSPFYVLDEVEAALDNVNLSRLLDLFERLRRTSQLLVITHQKRTMEIADALYGVAMRENGVSSVISQRMADVSPQ